MTLQFRQKSQQATIDELQTEMKLLRDYNKALEHENETRNQERKVLHVEIDRLLALQTRMKADQVLSPVINIMQSKEYIEIMQQYTQIKHKCVDIKNKYDSLLVEHQTLITNRSTKGDDDRVKKLQREKQGLQQTIRSYEMKIYGMEAQLSQCQSELTDLKKKDQGSSAMTREIFTLQTKLDQLERQLELKTNKLAQIQKEMFFKQNQLKGQISIQQTKVHQLEWQLRTKTQKQTSFNRQSQSQIDSLFNQIVTLQAKNSDLQRQGSLKQDLEQQLNFKDAEIRRLTERDNKSNSLSTNLLILQNQNQKNMKNLKLKNDEINLLKEMISQNSSELANKNQTISNLQMKALQKDEEMAKLKIQINSYSTKINSLSGELDRLERVQKLQTHTETIRYIEKEDINLKIQLEQLNKSNINFKNNIASLTSDVNDRISHIRDLERRISILEDTNLNLEQQLKMAIETKKTASRVSQTRAQKEDQLKEIIVNLKEELQGVRSFSQMVRQQNNELYTQLDQARSQVHSCKHTPKEKSRSRSRSPNINHRKILDKRQADKYNELTFHQTTISAPQPNGQSRHMVSNSPLTSNLYKTANNPTLSQSDRFNDLQRKIKQLKNQNQTLKYQLVFDKE